MRFEIIIARLFGFPCPLRKHALGITVTHPESVWRRITGGSHAHRRLR